MRKKLILKFLGKVLIGMAILFAFPVIVSLIYHEKTVEEFLIPQSICIILGVILNSIKTEKDDAFYAGDGLKLVALSWIIVSLIGALPFYLNHDLTYVDAVFETISGFTTTGATVFKDVEHLNHSILFWRGFTHLIGGMGVLTFAMAVIPLSRKDKSMHILKAEMPGPTVSKLVPNMKKTLAILYAIYLSLTFLEFILLVIFKMPFFDAMILSFSTAGTGGFSVLNSSVASYNIVCKYIIAIFMFLFGVNFNIYFLIIMGKFKDAIKSEELRVYFLLFVFSITVVFIDTINVFKNAEVAFTEAFFHVSSIMTSTGFSIGNINIYPTTSRVLMMALMIISACAGSTCGGLKISRAIICAKSIKRNLTLQLHPKAVKVVKFEGKIVSEDTIKNTNTFIFLYVILIVIITFIVGIDNYPLETTLNAVFTTFANVGLCFNISNFANFSNLSKIVLSIGMLLGRLEIFPMLSLVTDINNKNK